PPAQPPHLPGYTYERQLGSGGFADVFLYAQSRPQRQVAIKVLRSTIHDDVVRGQFETEANVMAILSSHPAIVTIHQADISDEERPFIVMEFCPRANYGTRFRTERITVAEALRVGVQIAGAVETAHRAGILHRDIKPANILVTAYNRPALTDFGISIASTASSPLEDSAGMSVPWSPPESFEDSPQADVRSDVFSLAATVYSLLAGRTPFERGGGADSAAELIHRIGTEPLRPLSRPDVPDSLNRVLSVAMAKDRSLRYADAIGFGRALQQVEQELALPVTGMDVMDDDARSAREQVEADDERETRTRLRAVTTIEPSGPRPRTSDPLDGVAPPLLPGRRDTDLRPSARSIEESTQDRPAPAAGEGAAPGTAAPALRSARDDARTRPADEDSAPRRRSPWPVVILSIVAVAALAAGAVLAVRAYFPQEQQQIPTADPDSTIGPGTLAAPGDPQGRLIVDDPGGPTKLRIEWEPPQGLTGDMYYTLRWADLPEGYEEQYGQEITVQGRESWVMDVPPNLPEVCFEVQVSDPGGSASDWSRSCYTVT
ncbi:MAG: serine/threonine-protein kinase, partial [Brachybacterium sp.]|nr:serine/threonine-protein kinase [Brachybacterium sp.]